MTKSPAQNLLELPDDFFDSVIDERQCVEYRATLDPRASFIELYRNLSLRVHVHLRGRPGSEFGNHCAVFGYDPVANTGVGEATTKVNTCSPAKSDCNTPACDHIASDSPWPSKLQATKVSYGADHVNQSVFVSIIDVGEHTEAVLLEPIRSFVRLEPLDNCAVFARDASKIAIFMLGVFLRVIEDGELETEAPLINGAECAHLRDKQVKSGTGVVSKISDDDADFVVRPNALGFSYDDIVRGIPVSLNDKGVGFHCHESIYNAFDRVEMLLCPAKLQSWPDEMTHVLHSTHGKRGQSGQAEDVQGPRDTHTQSARLHGELEEGGETQGITASPPEEVKSRTAPARRLGGYTAKRTRSGSLEDA
jgi:hypothetical protein